jgi:hypothetical protein
MSDASYPWGEPFQLRLLALLLRDPKKAVDLLEPSFFSSPMMTDIARITRDVYKSHPNSEVSISKTTLKELVQDSLGRKGQEHWPLYRRTIRKIYKMKLKDKEILIAQAAEFTRETRYRDALVRAERAITARKLGKVHEIIEQLKSFDVSSSGTVREEFEWDKLPRFNPANAPKTKWLVEDLIPERGITMLVGAPGAFKSTFSVLLATAVSKGDEFLERKTRKRRVLYLDNENPPDVLKTRDKSMKLEMEANRRLRLWSMYDERPVPKLLDKKLRLIVKKSVEEGRKVLIILDHWSSFLRAGDGGETTGQTSQLLQELKYLCALGATILLLHHTRKYEKDVEYGGNDLRAKCDAIHTLVLHQDSIDPNKKVIRMDCFLKRHGGNKAFSFRPCVENGEVVGFELTRDPQADERKRKRAIIQRLISKAPNMSQHRVVKKAQEQGLSRDEARDILKRGIGKYWRIKITAHGAKRYRLLEE